MVSLVWAPFILRLARPTNYIQMEEPCKKTTVHLRRTVSHFLLSLQMLLKLNPKPDSGHCFAFINQEEIKQDRKKNKFKQNVGERTNRFTNYKTGRQKSLFLQASVALICDYWEENKPPNKLSSNRANILNFVVAFLLLSSLMFD